ncbi:hypothetical protein DFS34DRAFT_665260 [Phlyctochytrium arcticum]|nr:hypothetical protein DFS34DRAFT_665260 [Phlyctochytrium arcticum]
MQVHDLLGIVEKCGSLEELSIDRCHAITGKALVKVLPFLQNLRKLDVTELSTVDDDCLRGIAKMCPLLEDLVVRGTSITKSGVSFIMEHAINLTSLNLSQCYKIKDSELRAILKGKPPHLTIIASDRHNICGNVDNSGSADSGPEPTDVDNNVDGDTFDDLS